MTKPQQDPNDPRKLHECLMEAIFDALGNGSTEAQNLLKEILSDRVAIVWTCPNLPFATASLKDNRLNIITDALGYQAFLYMDAGLHVSSADCHWLIAKLTGGSLQVVTAKRLEMAREAVAA